MEWVRYDRGEGEMWRKELKVEGEQGKKNKRGREQACEQSLPNKTTVQPAHTSHPSIRGKTWQEPLHLKKEEGGGLKHRGRGTQRASEIQGEMGKVIESLGGNFKNACEKQEEVKGRTGWSRCNKRTLL